MFLLFLTLYEILQNGKAKYEKSSFVIVSFISPIFVFSNEGTVIQKGLKLSLCMNRAKENGVFDAFCEGRQRRNSGRRSVFYMQF